MRLLTIHNLVVWWQSRRLSGTGVAHVFAEGMYPLPTLTSDREIRVMMMLFDEAEAISIVFPLKAPTMTSVDHFTT